MARQKSDKVVEFFKELDGQFPEMILQDRDYKILDFILYQKFASLEMVYLRFFDLRESESAPPPKNFWTTRQRLAKLRRWRLLKTEPVLSSGKAHYLVTLLGLKVLQAKSEDVISVNVTKQIDFSLFEHDLRVGMVRVSLERRGKCQKWYSEKILRAGPVSIRKGKYLHRFDRGGIIPDAIFINSKGERVALELEVSRKGPSKLRAKINCYKDLLLREVIDKVWIVATKMAIERSYREAIKLCVSEPHHYRYRVDQYERVVICPIE